MLLLHDSPWEWADTVKVLMAGLVIRCVFLHTISSLTPGPAAVTALAFPERAGKKGGAEDYDDAGSLCSTSTAGFSMGEAGETYIDAQAEAFSTAIDDTYESRASTREKAWERIVALLRNNVRQDDCYQRCGVSLLVCCHRTVTVQEWRSEFAASSSCDDHPGEHRVWC